MARTARVVVPGACYVSRSLARRDRKRKVKIPKIKYDVPRIGSYSIRDTKGTNYKKKGLYYAKEYDKK